MDDLSHILAQHVFRNRYINSIVRDLTKFSPLSFDIQVEQTTVFVSVHQPETRNVQFKQFRPEYPLNNNSVFQLFLFIFRLIGH